MTHRARASWLQQLPARLRRRFALGARGERFAARWLRRRGYSLLGRNVRLAGGEADLVMLARDRRTIVVVEVKTLTGERMTPLERVDAWKRRRLLRLGAVLLARPEHRNRAMRFDVVALRPRGLRFDVEHVEAAFDAT